jgi:hypothetical protein
MLAGSDLLLQGLVALFAAPDHGIGGEEMTGRSVGLVRRQALALEGQLQGVEGDVDAAQVRNVFPQHLTAVDAQTGQHFVAAAKVGNAHVLDHRIGTRLRLW